ncbi:fungal-specific transcription factor domain-containing protein [Crucibulum laeve]|uniref:Fungal-specific transcription factor domain-containing protein n=1 Tax=Crucibulum laeve TaxID=68775 RepID=A0A5C3MAP5_9AGAR|nr:fungal-specific transcription factor domain-containing protein [Crucibulum laeve]
MDWRESDPSDEENPNEDQQARARKRSSRACDQCRKTKSKCERPAGDAVQCKSCALAGTACTFLGPSYKRGPPKGYIHAIEQRWHQVEALLGSILQCPDPRVQAIVSDLRQDDLAREILGRVDMGPYGPSGRKSQPVDATKEDFFASILKSNESSSTRDSSRSRRQSRVSREIVSSSQDHGLSVVPTKQWQDNLSNRLTSSSSSGSSMNYNSYPSSHTSDDGVPATQRRRLNSTSTNNISRTDWNTMYTMDRAEEEYQDATDGIGELSLDENQEVRFHGQASGLHLLSQNTRIDDRIEGGIWRLPMARVWPPVKYGFYSRPSEDVNVPLPPLHVQDRMVDLYLTYIHPVFPVIHKDRFLADYHSRAQTDIMTMKEPQDRSSSHSPGPEPSQEVTPLLLLSIFSITARFSEDDMPYPEDGKMWESGCSYLDRARDTLTKVFHASRPSTVQSLLLLGYREFGIGSMEQGWLFIGMAIRMAFDLGLNCDSTTWKLHGHNLFSAEEIQTRRQIWWCCVAADRYGSIYMGRPTMIKDTDFDTPLPEIDPTEDNQPWQPYSPIDHVVYAPVPGRISSSFCASSRLGTFGGIILGSIITKVYPVRSPSGVSRQGLLAELEHRLDQWYINLPDGLRYEAASRRPTPPPQVLFLHLRYWGAVLLLHRAFIPNWKTGDEGRSPTASRALDHAQAAASHISAIVTVYHETFTLQRTSPFFTSYLLSAAIMHILTLTLRPANVEASLGIQRCMIALKEMTIVWPSAGRAWELLNGVQLRADSQVQVQLQPQDRNKRYAEDAFGRDKSSDYLPNGSYGVPTKPEGDDPRNNGVQELSTRLMAHMLGLDIPGVEPSTSYYPGYEWWPRPNEGSKATSAPPQAGTPSSMGILPSNPPNGEWMQDGSMSTGSLAPQNYPYGYGPYHNV